MGETMLNFAMPGNPRYQPKELIPYFGYDNIVSWIAKVEIANLHILGEIGVMPDEVYALLTPEAEDLLISISTTEVDEREKITKHDIRAWVELAKELVDPRLAQWVHVPLTSYDAFDTSRSLLYRSVYREVIRPKLEALMTDLAEMIRAHADVLQGGRTHGQPALPITVGFWVATLLNRIRYCTEALNRQAEDIVGKISGPVGASNAIVGLGFAELCGNVSYEDRVLKRLGLESGPISTQIVPPEPLAVFFNEIVLASGALGQLGRDGRNLMRLEIAELAEPFSAKQTGSSTMAHKRNPISFEGIEGQFVKNTAEYYKVLGTLISEHQRDLVGSTVYRDFPTMIINLVTQLNVLLRGDESGKSFLSRLRIDVEACRRNFDRTGHLILAEPLYIALQMAGYEADAHDVVNHVITPIAMNTGRQLIDIVEELAIEDSVLSLATEKWNAGKASTLAAALERIPSNLKELFYHPETYIGDASAKALEIAADF